MRKPTGRELVMLKEFHCNDLHNANVKHFDEDDEIGCMAWAEELINKSDIVCFDIRENCVFIVKVLLQDSVEEYFKDKSVSQYLINNGHLELADNYDLL